MPIDIPQRLLQEFSLKQQTELRKIANLIVDSMVAPGFKYIEEQGTADDSGTILSSSEICATVASLNGDISGSSNGVLVGGSGSSIVNGSNTVIIGGQLNESEGDSQTILLGGAGSGSGNAVNSAIVGGMNNSLNNTTNGFIAGGSSHFVDSGSRSAIIGGNESVVNGSDSVVIGGAEHVVSGAFAVILGGQEGRIGQSTFISDAAIVGGTNNLIDGTLAEKGDRSFIAAGDSNEIGVSDTFVTGQNALGFRRWSVTVGGGVESNEAASRSQSGMITGAVFTDDDTPTAMSFGLTNVVAPNGYLGVLDDSTFLGRVLITARRVSDGASYFFIYEVLASRVGGGPTNLIVQDEASSGGDSDLSAISVLFNEVTIGFEILVTGLPATDISWSCSVFLNEQQTAV